MVVYDTNTNTAYKSNVLYTGTGNIGETGPVGDVIYIHGDLIPDRSNYYLLVYKTNDDNSGETELLRKRA